MDCKQRAVQPNRALLWLMYLIVHFPAIGLGVDNATEQSFIGVSADTLADANTLSTKRPLIGL